MPIFTGSAIGESFGAWPRTRTRSLRDLVAALLLFALAAQPVLADGGAERYVFYLAAHANRSLDNLCVGDVVRIDVTAERFIANKRATDTDRNTNPAVQVYGVTIDGTVGNPEVGSLFFTKRITSARATPPGSAQFKFTATKAGTTGIVFKGTHIQTGWFMRFVSPDRTYLSTEVEVTVRNCEYSVTATGHWHAYSLDYTALISDVRLKSAGGGNYTGAGIWTFLITRVVGCSNTQVYEAPVTLNGTLEGDRLTVEITYDPPIGDWIYHATYDCSHQHAIETVTSVADDVRLTVDVEGESLSLPQTLRDRLSGVGDIEGYSRFTVRPAAPQ
jgi:hypothetical protein